MTIKESATWCDFERAHDLCNRQSVPFQHRSQKLVSAEANQNLIAGSAYHFQRASPLTGLWITKLKENCSLKGGQDCDIFEISHLDEYLSEALGEYIKFPPNLSYGCRTPVAACDPNLQANRSTS